MPVFKHNSEESKNVWSNDPKNVTEKHLVEIASTDSSYSVEAFKDIHGTSKEVKTKNVSQ